MVGSLANLFSGLRRALGLSQWSGMAGLSLPAGKNGATQVARSNDVRAAHGLAADAEMSSIHGREAPTLDRQVQTATGTYSARRFCQFRPLFASKPSCEIPEEFVQNFVFVAD